MSLSAASARSATTFTAVNFATYGLGFAATLVAARLIAPSAFGQAAIALTVADFLIIAAAWSFPTALLREPEESVDRLFRTALILGVRLNAAVLACSVLLAVVLSVVSVPRVGPMLVAVMVGRVIANIADFYATDLSRRFAYGRFSAIQFVSQVTSNVAMIALAAGGAGAWAIVGKDIIASVLTLPLAVTFSQWRFRREYDPAQARELLAFARRMIGSRLGDLMFHRYDNLVVAAVSGPVGLGLYSQAYVLAEIGNRAYGPTLVQVPMSNYARTQGERAPTSRTYNFIVFFLVRSVLPLFAVLALIPATVLHVVLGPEWAPGAGILRGLAFYALLLPFFEHARGLLIANGRVTEVLRARAVQLGVFLPLVPLLTAWHGPAGAAAAVAIAMAVGTAAILSEARKVVDLAPARAYAAPVLALAVGSVALLAVSGDRGDGLLVLVEAVVAFGAAYVAVLAVVEGRAIRHNVRVFGRNLRQGPAVQEPAQPTRP